MKLKRRHKRRNVLRRHRKLKRLQKGRGVWDNFKKSWNAVFF